MIKANHSACQKWLMNSYINYIIHNDFREIIYTNNSQPDNRSILLIANHFSWWDGFFAWHLNEKILKKNFHIMMLEQELKKRMFFSRVGAFSVNVNSRSVIESIDYTSNLLSNTNNLVTMFPQGKLGSHHYWEVKFRKGIERILQKANNTRVVFAVFLVDYYGNRKPTVTVTLKDYEGSSSLHEIENAYNSLLMNCIQNQDNLFTT